MRSQLPAHRPRVSASRAGLGLTLTLGLGHVKAVKGALYTTTKLRETKTYTVKNRNPQGRAVLIEHPVRSEFKLAGAAKPAEAAATPAASG